jgi:type VI secretion system secreted protein VgrG
VLLPCRTRICSSSTRFCVDSGVNHPGVISGLHSQALDGAGFNQWVLDDATGQLRMRLLSSYGNAQLGLGHLIQQGAAGAQRGAVLRRWLAAGTGAFVGLRPAA